GIGSPYYGGYYGRGYGYGYSPYYSGYDYGYSPYYSDSTSYYYSPPAYSYSSPNTTTAEFGEEQEARNANVANIRVHVPANAELWFEDSRTNQTGSDRTFVSPPLDPNRTFTYTLRAKWRDANGRDMDQTRQ